MRGVLQAHRVHAMPAELHTQTHARLLLICVSCCLWVRELGFVSLLNVCGCRRTGGPGVIWVCFRRARKPAVDGVDLFTQKG